MSNIELIMESQGTPTLKAIAAVFGMQATRLYTVAKTPKEGQVYDAKVYNWEAIEKFVSRRLGQQEDYPKTLEETISKALELDEQFKETDGRRAFRGGNPTGKKVEVDGVMIAQRRYPNHEMFNEDGVETGYLVALKKNPEVYKMIHQTRSHTVLVPVDDIEGTVTKNDVKVISNFMLNLNGYAPTVNDNEVEDRLSGNFEVAETTAE